MSNFSQITLVGRVANPEELKYLGSNNTPVLRFSVAVNTGYGDKKKVNWYRISAFGKIGESLKDYITKGKSVMVVGEHSNSEYTGNDGKLRWSNEVRVSQIVLLGDGGKPAPAKNEGREEPQLPSSFSEPEQGEFQTVDVPF